MILLSIGHGRCQLYPGSVVCTYLPKRKMTPRSCWASTRYKTAADPHGHDQSDQYAADSPLPKLVRETSEPPMPPAAAAEQRRQAPLKIAQHVVQIVLRLLRAVPRITLSRRQVRSKPCLMPNVFAI